MRTSIFTSSYSSIVLLSTLLFSSNSLGEVRIASPCTSVVKNFYSKQCANPALVVTEAGIEIPGIKNSARLKNKQLLTQKETKQFWAVESTGKDVSVASCNYFEKGAENKFKMTFTASKDQCLVSEVVRVGAGSTYDKKICDGFLAHKVAVPEHQVCYQQAKDYLKFLADQAGAKGKEILGNYSEYMKASNDSKLAASPQWGELNKNLPACRKFFSELEQESKKGMLKIALKLHGKASESLDRIYKNYQSCGDMASALGVK
jgi:hypothetical protein